MLSIQRIVVGTDFSEGADHALDYAIDLAKKLGATVTVVHGYQVPVYGVPDGAFIASAEYASRLSTAAQKALDDLSASRAKLGVAITTDLRTGPPWEVVIDAAKETQADLVVVATHGRKGIARALIGSVAEKVVRTSPVPVVVVPQPHA